MLCSDRTFTRLNGSFVIAEQRKSNKAIAVAFWCRRAKADSVAEAEMMSRSAWLRRLVAAKVGEVLA
jgi:hypothetical protein